MERINVTQSFMPPIEEYEVYLKQLWDSRYLTNQGPLLKEFQTKAEEYLGLQNFLFVANGTLALQLALRALDITEGEIITTPFTHVGTTSAILWERCRPVYVDIEPDTFNIDAGKIEAAITPHTRAIMAVHVFGFPCDTDKIEAIAKKHDLKVIYDAAHAFGAKHQGKSLLDYGDVSTCSFHATKLIHTVEGGAVIARDQAVRDHVDNMQKFGYVGDNYIEPGINAKVSEFSAAMGLCNLKYIDEIIARRRRLAELYDRKLSDRVHRPKVNADDHNYIYYPVLFDSEQSVLDAFDALKAENIYARRYFHPSLNTLSYVEAGQKCPVSEDIASRVLCLPLYYDLDEAIVEKICHLIG